MCPPRKEKVSSPASGVPPVRIIHSINSLTVEESAICLPLVDFPISSTHFPEHPKPRRRVSPWLVPGPPVDHLRFNDPAANQSLIKLEPNEDRTTARFAGNRRAQHQLSSFLPSVYISLCARARACVRPRFVFFSYSHPSIHPLVGRSVVKLSSRADSLWLLGRTLPRKAVSNFHTRTADRR